MRVSRDFVHNVARIPARMRHLVIGSRRGERAMKKKKTNPRKRVVTQADINKAQKQAFRDLSLAAIVLSAMSLHDVFDFGPERLERFIVDVVHKQNDWDAGLFEIDDALEWLESYSGVGILEVMEGDKENGRKSLF